MPKGYTDEWKKRIPEMLSPKRLKHTLGVRETAVNLAKHYGEDEEKAEIASMCHDIFRGKPIDEINALVKHYGLDDIYLNNANLAHGKLAACFMKEEMGIEDSQLLDCVSFHTTGRADMTMNEKIVFIADAIEPGRDYPGVEEIRKYAFDDIDKACYLSLKGTVEHLMESGMKYEDIHHDTTDALKYFEERIK